MIAVLIASWGFQSLRDRIYINGVGIYYYRIRSNETEEECITNGKVNSVANQDVVSMFLPELVDRWVEWDLRFDRKLDEMLLTGVKCPKVFI